MKTNCFFVSLATLCLLPASCAIGQATDCKTDRAQFVSRNDASIQNDRGTEYKKHFEQIAGSLSRLITEVAVKNLNAGAAAGEISAYLGCITSVPDDAPAHLKKWLAEFTNAPAVLTPAATVPPQAIVATYPLIGYTASQVWAIAPSRPIVQCFARNGDRWSLVGELGGEYSESTFSIYPLPSPVKGQAWSLLAGTHIGDTGSRLLLEVVVCDGKTFIKKWTRGEITVGKVEVSGNAVLLTWEKIFDETGRRIFSETDPPLYTEVLHVTSNGLE